MKEIKIAVYLVATLIVLFSPANAIAEHIKQETVEPMGYFTPQPYMQSSIGNQEMDQTLSADEQLVPGEATWQGSSGQEQIGGDYQSGYQAGYANGWWDGVQAAVQLLLRYLNSLQDTGTALSEFDKYGINRPGGQATMEGPKIKQAVDALTPQVGDL